MTQNKGAAMHQYHDKLFSYCPNYQERVDSIEANKPKHEIPLRKKLFKIVDEKLLPAEFVEACKKWDEADKKWNEAYKKWNEACKKRDEAYKKWNEADKKYLPQLEELHKKICSKDCTWNGKEIVFR